MYALFAGYAMPLFDRASTLEGLLELDDRVKHSFFAGDRAHYCPPVDLVIHHLVGDESVYADRFQTHRQYALDRDKEPYRGGVNYVEQLEHLHAYLQQHVKPRHARRR